MRFASPLKMGFRNEYEGYEFYKKKSHALYLEKTKTLSIQHTFNPKDIQNA